MYPEVGGETACEIWLALVPAACRGGLCWPVGLECASGVGELRRVAARFGCGWDPLFRRFMASAMVSESIGLCDSGGRRFLPYWCGHAASEQTKHKDV